MGLARRELVGAAMLVAAAALCLLAFMGGAAEVAASLPFVAGPRLAVVGSAWVAALLLAAWVRSAPTVLEPPTVD